MGARRDGCEAWWVRGVVVRGVGIGGIGVGADVKIFRWCVLGRFCGVMGGAQWMMPGRGGDEVGCVGRNGSKKGGCEGERGVDWGVNCGVGRCGWWILGVLSRYRKMLPICRSSHCLTFWKCYLFVVVFCM